MSSSPNGIAAKDVEPTPGPVAPLRWWTTVGERRAFGWLAIAASLVLSVPVVLVFREIFRAWDRLGQATSPLWVLPLVLVCYVAFPVAFLCVGRGLLSGRTRLVGNGGWLLAGAVTTFLTLFTIFD